MNALVEALRGTKRVDTGITRMASLVSNEYYEHERCLYKPFESDFGLPNPEIYKYEIPEVSILTLLHRSKKMGAGNDFNDIKRVFIKKQMRCLATSLK